MIIRCTKKRERFRRDLQLRAQPLTLVLPLQLRRIEFRRTMPCQPVAVMPRLLDIRHERIATFLERPVRLVAVKHEVLEAARQKMFRRQPRVRRVIKQHARKFQMRPAKTEIHRRLFRLRHKLRQVIPRPKPCQNSISLPPPGHDLLLRRVWAQMPAMFLRKPGDTPVQPVVIPAQREQNTTALLVHGKILDEQTPFASHSP